MIGIIADGHPALVRARQNVQVIHVVAGRGNRWTVITAWNEHRVPVGHRLGQIDLAVARVEPVEPKAGADLPLWS